MWRGGLPPLECEALPKPADAIHQLNRDIRFATASQPNGGKPPRHKVPRYKDFGSTEFAARANPRSAIT
ncbi:hypothetical protein EAH78_28540 [Pseudomonas arsenicoxydans]|uniref:Uncharacterized protein n=1 Tax=Pseudomonas arsenicoxydans TaxID=702115 RepID=A0A502HCU8_9PSED|nr:hypothetical protein EAH78_28540 [Pseudomonas arsenicoxydans]